jgi:pimeloyl-ACP methyl ester carboxylesterase
VAPDVAGYSRLRRLSNGRGAILDVIKQAYASWPLAMEVVMIATCDLRRLIFALTAGGALALSSPVHAAVKTIVLVHGAFADGSGWKPVADILEGDGYAVRIVQEPETSFEADVAATRRVLDKAGPCVLVGHSYGGMIVTEAGAHTNVKALVYVAAFQPEVGEVLGELAGKIPAAAQSIEPVGDGFLAVNADAFPDDFASDVPKPVARFMAISQVPISGAIFGAKATVAAWKDKPSYAVVATQDRMINPDLERFMSKRAHSETIELTGSHAIFLAHAPEVAAFIEKAAEAAK